MNTSSRRPVTDLAPINHVTPAAIYRAVKDGLIPCIPAGRKMMMSEESFQYHSRFGYGRGVPCHGTPEAVAFEAAQGGAA